MRFHIQNHHTPENCGTHLEERKEGINSVADWPARCKELGITYLMGGSCRPQHTGFMFVEADDLTNVTDLLRPTMGRDECVVTPVTER